jgi:hypothetical protein
MKKIMLALALVLGLCGCFGADHGDLLKENRKHLVEKVWPSYADALQNAKYPDGKPLYIVELRDAQLEIVTSMIQAIDTVLPPEGEEKAWTPPAVPWADELKAAQEAAPPAEGGAQ